MQGREPLQPIKSQLTQVGFNGKLYSICTQGQMNYLVAVARNSIINEAAREGRVLTEEDIEKAIEIFKEDCGYAVLTELLAKVSPEERQRWETNYRFAGVSRKAGE